MVFSSNQKAYIAGFLVGDGSIYVQMKPNSSYKFGFQISPYIVFFQSSKCRENFEKVCNLVGLGYIRERKDEILEYIIGKRQDVLTLLEAIEPYVLLKKKQVELMKLILTKKDEVKTESDFLVLAELVDNFRDLNYSKKRKRRTLTP
ncbi:MAG: hypothetical protein COU07_02165 [Candidatus Harrisonbacteria bacterium CG10_big_fil_rev_8_21_14_0_10_40_38]|uniref:Homing endonuclease LAGLIDADG domain-containing protein n=1 Tax=Candidatus Harrisonbacteria bacterium CG10_big_fil_rev_8_21_14_0_10_40_38 TaxID=1974583 RepID=A0A2H0UUD1_9BACT|nr:MAG: hypothetical protein COU07_02165 [Candidatus Harrisonbacteria bacterium CG10_big_fil_rev_8_21_14_0_10_40_38]